MSIQFEFLAPWGWNSHWQELWLASHQEQEGREPARIVGREGPEFLIQTTSGLRQSRPSGKLWHEVSSENLPVVGDWVSLHVRGDQPVIDTVLPRLTVFSRGVVNGRAAVVEQVLCANVDVLLVVTGLDGNFNVSRAQRISTLARRGGISTVWVLSKADLDPEGVRVREARQASGGNPVVAVSALTGEGVEALVSSWSPGQTVALAGSSGVGKTSLVNRILGWELATKAVRAADDKGRHTTTARHLYRLPSGALLMDAPGFRSVSLWADSGDVNDEFSDIEGLASQCRFADCRHESEPGCAVRAALADGTLSEERWTGWHRQSRETRFLERRHDRRQELRERAQLKERQRFQRTFTKEGRSFGSDEGFSSGPSRR